MKYLLGYYSVANIAFMLQLESTVSWGRICEGYESKWPQMKMYF